MGTGQASVKRYNRQLRDTILTGRARPGLITSYEVGLDQAVEAYERFDRREDGWTKVLLHPGGVATEAPDRPRRAVAAGRRPAAGPLPSCGQATGSAPAQPALDPDAGRLIEVLTRAQGRSEEASVDRAGRVVVLA